MADEAERPPSVEVLQIVRPAPFGSQQQIVRSHVLGDTLSHPSVGPHISMARSNGREEVCGRHNKLSSGYKKLCVSVSEARRMGTCKEYREKAVLNDELVRIDRIPHGVK